MRRQIRIRYASRTNVDKIFSDYDSKGKGLIDAHDVHAQAGHLGLKMTLDEA